MWKHTGTQRPDFAIEPKLGQESVWDYPRPPALVSDRRKIEVFSEDGVLIARAASSIRVLETASPPTFYIAPDDILTDLIPCDGATYCEWKGQAEYFQYQGHRLAWRYPKPTQAFAEVAGWYSFYPAECRCLVAGQTVRAQAGGFYGGWVTDEIVGPYKGEPGRSDW